MTKIKVTHFQRRPRSAGNYSVEFIFKDVRERLKDTVESTVFISKYHSSGLFRRVYNVFEAALNQNEINHVTGDVSFIGILLNRRKTIQTILDVVYLNKQKGLKHKVLKYFWLTLPEKKCRYITAISEATKQEILKYHNCDPDKIVVIPVAISDAFKPHEKIFNASKPVILQLGAADNKNIPRLIEALRGIDCQLEIVGKTNDEYEKLLQAANITYNYSQNLSDEEIIKKYEEADIVTLVSTYEGFGMPILEAQAIGRPVITANILSMPEVAGDGACLVDPYNVSDITKGFHKIINDSNYREELISNGKKNIERYNPNTIANQYLDLYKSIVEE